MWLSELKISAWFDCTICKVTITWSQASDHLQDSLSNNVWSILPRCHAIAGAVLNRWSLNNHLPGVVKMLLIKIPRLFVSLTLLFIPQGRLSALLCPRIVVYNADYADCNGEYDVTQETVSWAPDRRVYAHRSKDRWGCKLWWLIIISIISDISSGMLVAWDGLLEKGSISSLEHIGIKVMFRSAPNIGNFLAYFQVDLMTQSLGQVHG